MPVIKVDESNADLEFEASKEAIRDFLYTYFDVAGDCLPTGDWERAERGRHPPGVSWRKGCRHAESSRSIRGRLR